MMDIEALHRAVGLAFATLDALLTHKGVLQPGELRGHLGLIAAVTDEEDSEVGMALASIAGMLEQTEGAPLSDVGRH